ncbi:MAG: dTDP-4-dehydrorhamnose 3,5-epimerase [Nitrospira sp.]|nr:dTDP-4-dehydrorhamnose 3,5-epimerase [Nitrospira sp.]MCW5795800.1 dTDP-4-dehydrorhamnose 3,5-epimerase [Nitrospira sp.]HNC82380.1 dTDP-4-dehydrorhamnose 3,5-epimerase [Nitrospira sp.]
MTFRETVLKGAFTIDLDRVEDERGFFARSWCVKEFEANGLDTRLVQCNVSFNKVRGTLRGMHYQVAPAAEVKVVRCTRGAVHDVIADLRPDSPTYKQAFSVLLSAENRRMLYIPKGFAHGFLTLTDDAEVFYQMSEYYAPECARGFRWDDATFAISWPDQVRIISSKDRNYPDFAD